MPMPTLVGRAKPTNQPTNQQVLGKTTVFSKGALLAREQEIVCVQDCFIRYKTFSIHTCWSKKRQWQAPLPQDQTQPACF